jgi:hypothetical protein
MLSQLFLFDVGLFFPSTTKLRVKIVQAAQFPRFVTKNCDQPVHFVVNLILLGKGRMGLVPKTLQGLYEDFQGRREALITALTDGMS